MPTPFFIFPHQLFKEALSLPKDTPFYLIEDERFFHRATATKERIAFHRATMQAFRERFLIKGYQVHYLDAVEFPTLKSVVSCLQKEGIGEVRWYALGYPELEDQFLGLLERATIGWEVLRSPVLSEMSEVRAKRINLPKLPASWHPEPNRYVEEAVEYTQVHFARHAGSLEQFTYPVTYDDALDWLEDFLLHRLPFFAKNGGTVFRQSPLPLLMGIGLLVPHQVRELAKKLAAEHRISQESLHALLKLVAE